MRIGWTMRYGSDVVVVSVAVAARTGKSEVALDIWELNLWE